MSDSVFEKLDQQAADSIHKISHTTSAFVEALENGMDAAKRVGKHGSDVAEEFMDDTILRVKRHPVETVVAAFALGVAVGGLADLLLRRR